MRIVLKKLLSVTLAVAIALPAAAMTSEKVSAENPLIQTTYTADPAPLVVGDTLYLYTTHDELRETKYDDWSYMNDWRCYSTTDMVNWTDHGQIAHANTFDGGKNNWRAWAHQVAEVPIYEGSTGEWVKKYFLVAPFNGTKIDVAVADTPTGPFYDATPGKYLIDGGWGGGNIDPTIYIEDHGNPDDYANYDIYMYWGNPYIRYCKLTNDMLDVDPDTDGDGVLSDYENSLDPRFNNEDNKILGEVRPGLHSFDTLGDAGYASFGAPSQGASTTQKYPAEPAGSERKRCAFEEGPWVIKHDDGNPETDDYFMFFVGGRTPGETVEYSTAPTPLGPWTYRAFLMDREYGYSCIHPGIVEYKGKNYLFYLNQKLVGGDGSNRSVCVLEFEYDENNLVKRQTPESNKAYFVQGMETPEQGLPFYSVDPIDTLNPYLLNEAETICWESNFKSRTGGFNGTGLGVKTKAKEQYEETDLVTGLPAFWQSAYYNGVVVYDIDNEDYIKLREVNFGDREAISFKADLACGEGLPPVNTTTDNNGIMIPNPDADTVGGTLEVWIDYEDKDNAKCIAALDVSDTGGTNSYQTFETDLIEPVTGVHDLYFIFYGEDGKKLFNFDSWQFTQKEAPATPEPVVTPAPATPAPQIQPTPAPEAEKAAAPAKVKIKSVKKAGKKLKVTWKKATGADGYQIALATKKGGKYKIKLTVKAPKTKGTVKKISPKKKLFVKVRAYALDGDSKVYGKYSSAKKVK